MTTTQCPPEIVSRELLALHLMTASRERSQEDFNLIIQFYADLLTGYPAHIVVAVCRHWTRREKFWPTSAELYGLLDLCVDAERRRTEMGEAV
jgi:hypothetical protein